jgi:hypothetical protein
VPGSPRLFKISSKKKLKVIESNFEPNLAEEAKNLSDDFNTRVVIVNSYFLGNYTFVAVHDVTLKQLQTLLMTSKKKV